MGYTRNVEIVALALEGRLVTVECHLDSNGLTGRGKENERKGPLPLESHENVGND